MRPTRRLLMILGVWVALSCLVAWLPPLVDVWVGAAAALMMAVVIEAFLLRRQPSPILERTSPLALALGEWQDIRLRIDGHRRAQTVTVFDHVPRGWLHDGLPITVSVPAQRWVEVTYRTQPKVRGRHTFQPALVVIHGVMGLLDARRRTGSPTEVKVYPNFRKVSQYALLASQNRTHMLGVHLRQRRGEGLEFLQLRDYRQGDSIRQIDWKAVSRRHQLISREYREERNQHVVFLLDCGRRMRAVDDNLSHFDHVLNAVLLLSYVATRQGDSVGLMTFSGASRWLPPVKGGNALNTVLNTVYDLQTSTAASDLAEATQQLSALQRRRALVIVITNLRDDDVQTLPAALAPLRRRHLVMLASLREGVLDQTLAQPIHAFNDALRFSSTLHYLDQRRRAHDVARGHGATVLDVTTETLPASLVNHYLDIKRSGRL